MSWHPVTRNAPCLICKKSKNGYCMVSDKGEFLCMRIESNRPLTLKTGEVGWVHKPDGVPIRLPEKRRPELVINVSKLMTQWHKETPIGYVKDFAFRLGVVWTALAKLGCAWAPEHRAFAFPMSDGYGNFIGIRLRTPEGSKFAVRGSHQGIFLPECESGNRALVLEGPTDTAAALTMGYFAIGRPSCSGGVHDIVTTFRRLGVTEAVIISDNDEVGSRGGVMLQNHLKIQSALIVLPAKDLRAFVQLGGTRELLDSMIENLIWKNP